MTDKDTIANLSADRPISSLDEDLLGRGDFAIGIASALRHWKGSESLVVGIYGEWGSGKSSIKNCVLSLLDKADDGPIAIEFNPWSWSGEDRLATAFFDEIGTAIGGHSQIVDSKDLAAKWKKYADRLAMGATASGHLSKVAKLIGMPWLPTVLDSTTEVLSQAKDFTEEATEVLCTSEPPLPQTLDQLKTSLSQALSKLSTPILIVIDDIDRLTTDENRTLFRLVKANANLPNLIFYCCLIERLSRTPSKK